MNEKSDYTPFDLIDVNVEPNGIARLRYGSGLGDPLPFVLTITPQFVATASSKSLPISIQDVQEYIRKYPVHLKAIAQNAKARGLNAEVLE